MDTPRPGFRPLRTTLVDARHASTPAITADDGVLLERSGGGSRDDAWLMRVLRATAAAAGLRILDEAFRYRRSDDELWLAERGISVEWIPRADRARRVPSTAHLLDAADTVRQVLSDPETRAPCGCGRRHQPMAAEAF